MSCRFRSCYRSGVVVLEVNGTNAEACPEHAEVFVDDDGAEVIATASEYDPPEGRHDIYRDLDAEEGQSHE